jgi:hypothetical protein
MDVSRRGFLGVMFAAGVGQAIKWADSLVLPGPQHDVAHSPWEPPIENLADRRAWANAVALYLSTLGEAVGLDGGATQIRKVLDHRGMASRVCLAHPLVEIEVFLYRTRTGIGLFYQPGLESPQRRSREYPGGRQYSAVFRDATTPTDDRLVHRLRWLAGFENCSVRRAA